LKKWYGNRVYFEGIFSLSDRLGLGITPDNFDETFRGQSAFGYLANLWDFAKSQQDNFTLPENEEQ
jgi:alanine-alpha-ketoisovalerate/valine-pyruvate aminotransferase